MLFVLRQRDGVTGSLAAYLEQFSSSTADIRVCVEGPYGAPIDVEQYDEMLLVAGGSGITHMASSEFHRLIHPLLLARKLTPFFASQ